MKQIDMMLSDGSVLKELEVNGNCLIANYGIKGETLTDEMLREVTVNGQRYENITLVRKWVENNKTWLAFRQKTEDELWKEIMLSNMDYIAMMTDVDVEV